MNQVSVDRSRHESPGLGLMQRRRKRAFFTAAVLLGLALPFIKSVGSSGGFLHEAAEIFGMVMIGVAIVGRSWCALYIGGRKAHEVVATGPYSISRNPLYLFSLLGVAGIGLQTGSFVMGLFLSTIALAIFFPVIRREETMLSHRFGAEYESYRARVPRFGPSFTGWRDMQAIVVHPRRLWRTFTEALLFLLAMPICEAVDKLQDAGYFVPFVYLP